MKKLLAILASASILLACATTQQFPTNKSYSVAIGAPDWMVESYLADESGNYGLLEWFGWQTGGHQYHMIKTDLTRLDGNLDGKCDEIVFAVETDAGPQILGTSPCEKWEEIKENIFDDLRKGSV